MNTLKWLFKPSGKAETKDNEPPISTEQLLSKIRGEHLRLTEIEEQCHFQSLQIDMSKGYLEKANRETGADKATIVSLRVQVAQLNTQVSNLKKKNSSLLKASEDAGKKKKDINNKLQQQVSQLTADLAAAKVSLGEADLEIDKLKAARSELQFECELLKCTNSKPLPEIASTALRGDSAPIPFVLVLVDGDAYSWSARNFLQKTSPPGAQAAYAIKIQVRDYLLANKDRLPLQSRIVTRVFCNFDGIPGLEKRSGKYMHNTLKDFAKSFTQSTPLFDFFDAGYGKERVDEKIKETFHLFVSNPQCHAVFLAAAVDNGFARLLEQYACDEAIREKVVLVHPGYIIHEIADLNFKAVEWPTVFQRAKMPSDALSKANKISDLLERREQSNTTELNITLTKLHSEHVRMRPLRNLSIRQPGIWTKPTGEEGHNESTVRLGAADAPLEELD
ncbi:hypothetical protein H2198_008324 [Neophaeococcomyces mojaviensis]|uniref:Uncharacterized protein n=1 Tax=Neophaeococcomyces mojaviensis TaxID=3383035 RepID=A0ACC2ZXL4_9EURO|nr:hypothetical protein H2198_008324 [Knufia sp. JES_112]